MNKDKLARAMAKQISSDLTSIKPYAKNIINGLIKFTNVSYPTVCIIGDSIVAGSGASDANTGFAKQLVSNLGFTKGHKGILLTPNTPLNSGWTQDSNGINKNRYIGTQVTALDLIYNQNVYQMARTAKIVYETHSDGGVFDILVNGSVVSSPSCSGTDGYATTTVSIPSNQTLSVRPQSGQKVYISFAYATIDGVSGSLVIPFGNPGKAIQDYTDSELINTINICPSNLTIIEFLANDITRGDINLFRQKYDLAIITALNNGSVMLLATEQYIGVTDDTYKTWVQVMKDLAIKYNCALVSVNDYWGGIVQAQAKGLYSDNIHPSQLGHDSIARLLTSILLPENKIDFNQIKIQYGKYEYPNYYSSISNIYPLKTKLPNDWWYSKPLSVQPVTADQTAYRPTAPILGQMHFDTTLGKPIWCKQTTPSVIWVDSTGTTV